MKGKREEGKKGKKGKREETSKRGRIRTKSDT